MDRCTSKTKKNIQCSRRAKFNGKCAIHYKMLNKNNNKIIKQEIILEELILNESDEYECQCCYDKFIIKEMFKCSKFSKNYTHIYCKECIKNYIENMIADNKSSNSCMLSVGENKCCGTFDYIKAKNLFETENDIKIFSQYEEQIEKKYLSKFKEILNNYYTCPLCNEYGVIVENMQLKNLNCKKCNKNWCLKCNRVQHEEEICFKFNLNDSKEKIIGIIQEEIANAIIHKCPKCNAKYTKIEGCNLITCSSCHTYSCYICGIKLEPKNGSKYYHFNIEKKCPLWNGIGNLKDGNNFNNIKATKICQEIYDMNKHNDYIQKIILEEVKKHNIKISEANNYLQIFGIDKVNKVNSVVEKKSTCVIM